MDNSGKIKTGLFNTNLSSANSQNNPFGNGTLTSKEMNFVPADNKPVSRLNGYDSTILNKANFDNSQEQELSLDYKIKEKESVLKELDEKIKLADNYGTQNEALGLKAKKQRISQELMSLKQQAYGNTKTGQKDAIYHSTFKDKMPLIYKMHDFVSRNVLAKISKKVRSVVTLTDSLEQLSEISKNIDELTDLNIPYGERVQNYEKLTEYLNRANVIHSKISKSMRK